MALETLSKEITISDMKKFSETARSLPFFPPFGEGQLAQDIRVEDEEGREWTFRLIIRGGRYRKPILGAGWRRFVRRKNLQPGFKVQFFMEADEETGEPKYRIRTPEPEPVILFGVVISHAPYNPAG